MTSGHLRIYTTLTDVTETRDYVVRVLAERDRILRQ